MTEFLRQIADRLAAARGSLEQARLDEDDYLIQVRSGEIESLQRLYDEHSGGTVIDLEGRPTTTLAVDPVVVALPDTDQPHRAAAS